MAALWPGAVPPHPTTAAATTIAANQLGVITANSNAVAFQHDHKLYLADLGGAERAIAQRELPLGWTVGGLFTYQYQRRQLLLRSDSGALVKAIAQRPLGSDYSVANGSLYFITRGVLISAHGTHVTRLTPLKRLGLLANPWLQPLGRLVELQDDHRLVVVRADGIVRTSSSPCASREPASSGTESGCSTATPKVASR